MTEDVSAIQSGTDRTGSVAPSPSNGGRSSHLPLADITVLDLTSFLSGPFGTQILADLGANVIKVEPPSGDSSRIIPPHFVGSDSAYFLANNRGKRSVSIDLKTPEGVELATELARRCDVVVENFRPGVCERLGLDPDRLLDENPRLVWASISGFGLDSPWRDRPAYDIIVQALAGVMSVTGEESGPPVRLGVPLGDLAAGMYAVIGVLGALADRDDRERGRRVDVAMLDCQLAMLNYLAAYSMIGGETPDRQGRGHRSIPTYRAFKGSDGREFVIAANTERMWRDLCEVIGQNGLLEDPRFLENADRLEHQDELWEILEEAFTGKPAGEWVELLATRSVPAGLIKSVPEALDDADRSPRRMVLELHHPDGEDRPRVVGNPIKISGDRLPPPTYPPGLGADTSDVLKEMLGTSDDEIAALKARGVVHGT